MAAPDVRPSGATSTAGRPPVALPPAGEATTDAAEAAAPPGRREAAKALGRLQKLAAEIEHLELKPIQRAYLRERWLGQLAYFGRSARSSQRRYYALRLVAILGGVTVPALVGLNVDGDGETAVRWLAFALGLLVAAAVALEEFFRYGERWRHFRQQAELLHSEGWAFLELAGSYRDYADQAAAFGPFVGRVEEALRQEVGVFVAELARPQEVRRSQDGAPSPGTTPGARPGANADGGPPAGT